LITFQQGNTGGFGQIVGGSFDGTTWLYTVEGGLGENSRRAVQENEITYLFTNGSWLAPTHLGGSGSAYKDA
jgi:hypothetical protein